MTELPEGERRSTQPTAELCVWSRAGSRPVAHNGRPDDRHSEPWSFGPSVLSAFGGRARRSTELRSVPTSAFLDAGPELARCELCAGEAGCGRPAGWTTKRSRPGRQINRGSSTPWRLTADGESALCGRALHQPSGAEDQSLTCQYGCVGSRHLAKPSRRLRERARFSSTTKLNLVPASAGYRKLRGRESGSEPRAASELCSSRSTPTVVWQRIRRPPGTTLPRRTAGRPFMERRLSMCYTERTSWPSAKPRLRLACVLVRNQIVRQALYAVRSHVRVPTCPGTHAEGSLPRILLCRMAPLLCRFRAAPRAANSYSYAVGLRPRPSQLTGSHQPSTGRQSRP